jgi:hypothetical protein
MKYRMRFGKRAWRIFVSFARGGCWDGVAICFHVRIIRLPQFRRLVLEWQTVLG